MTAPLTLPGTIPGLLRRGSPVVWAAPIRPNPTLPAHLQAGPGRERRGLWMPLGPKADEGMVCWDTWCGANRVEEHVYAGDLALDLSDPTGRAHAAWWLGNSSFDDVLAACDALGISRVGRKNAMAGCMEPIDGWDHSNDADTLRRVVLHVAGREVTRG